MSQVDVGSSNWTLSLTRLLRWVLWQVDADRSNSLDVFEFFYLAFLMTHDGSYSDLVEASQVNLLYCRRDEFMKVLSCGCPMIACLENRLLSKSMHFSRLRTSVQVCSHSVLHVLTWVCGAARTQFVSSEFSSR